MATHAVTSQDFNQVVESNDLVFVDFWATWCGPCRAFGPTFEKASEANPDVYFAKVDIRIPIWPPRPRFRQCRR